jgi:uncharacterized protein
MSASTPSTSPASADKVKAASTTLMAPVGKTERLDVLDILRGFALGGVAIVNIALGSTPVYTLASNTQLWTNPLDQLAIGVIRFFAEGKFYPLFSFLFGLGFALMLTNAVARGGRFGWVYTRRLVVLLAFGLVHAFFIWFGDILVLYSLLGVVLLVFFRHRRPRALLVWVSIFLLVPLLLYGALVGLLTVGRASPESAAQIDASLTQAMEEYRVLADQANRVYSSGTWAEIQAQRTQDVLFLWSTMPFFAPTVFAMFLLGVYAHRRGVFQDVSAHLPFVGRVFLGGLVLGLSGSVGYVLTAESASRAVPTFDTLLMTAAFGLGGPALAMAYAAGLILLLHHKPAWRRRLAPLGAAGRMALTNYLLQSILATGVLYSYGLGLYGIGPAAALLLAVAIYVVNVLLSVWWLRHFQFGPAEWLWRSLTYLRPQPFRRPLGNGPAGTSPAVA